MSINRREFLQLVSAAAASGFIAPDRASARLSADFERLYELPPAGNATLLHFTDCHAQLNPVYFREPSINIGVGVMKDRPPHFVGRAFLDKYKIPAGGRRAYAFTYLDFVQSAHRYGRIGGFAHLSTLVSHLRAQRPSGSTLLLDGGDTWQGSATSLWTQGRDMIEAQKLLGIDAMTGHWDFTYGADHLLDVIKKDFTPNHIEFLAQNVIDDTWGDPVFKPYIIRELGGVPVAIIGQAFPYTPIANPAYFTPHWQFGIDDHRMQKSVDKARAEGAQVVVVLSHNGMDVDLKMASLVTGIDFILGGHTHDAVPAPSAVRNAGGTTYVMNSGSNGKFLGVLDFKVRNKKLVDHRFVLLPIFSDLIPEDPKMAAHIRTVRAPYMDRLSEHLATADGLLYRRGNFNGTLDQMIVEAQLAVQGAEIAFSPGFRWGTSVLPGDAITMEDVMAQTAITYPTVTLNEYTGAQIKTILEDVGDNLFNKDPYYQQGGDMIRTGGLRYTMDPSQNIGQRISDLTLANGKPLDPSRKYKVAGWASVQKIAAGRPIWDVVAEYLRHHRTLRVTEPFTPRLRGVRGNKGYAAT